MEMTSFSCHAPNNCYFTIISVESQILPHSFRRIHHVVLACSGALIHRVTLVHHLRHRTPSVSSFYSDHSPAQCAVTVPSGGQRHHSLRQRMELAVALGGAPSISAATEVVESENGRSSRGIDFGGMRTVGSA